MQYESQEHGRHCGCEMCVIKYGTGKLHGQPYVTIGSARQKMIILLAVLALVVVLIMFLGISVFSAAVSSSPPIVRNVPAAQKIQQVPQQNVSAIPQQEDVQCNYNDGVSGSKVAINGNYFTVKLTCGPTIDTDNKVQVTSDSGLQDLGGVYTQVDQMNTLVKYTQKFQAKNGDTYMIVVTQTSVNHAGFPIEGYHISVEEQ